ncbi:ACT domain-containing protein [Terribacillus saccharophilus]|uniref:ACT domain-containing protein n=1 Tax=Terribacillus saccharophilus TaxID=361277 RepID=UPI002989FD56|nr:ACT domain-containing protein [Terribacillus saccharophilus]MCM3224365.1 ACT domain-containing protein [Terribacillus saccharophilus]MEC0283740.1 ACT domain-containing protein [Terribacillus saccharophilus]MEC0290696.1 ACT domain-containing protein [Terribacillus saccharophilus]
MAEKEEQFYLVRSDVLPESMKKTLQAKELLERKKVASVFDAVQQVDLSRSVFYKYRDAVFPFRAMVKQRMITLFFHLEDRTGTLSELLAIVARSGGNILTIHQTIPLQGRANVTISLNTAGMRTDIQSLLDELRALAYVDKVEILSSEA